VHACSARAAMHRQVSGNAWGAAFERRDCSSSMAGVVIRLRPCELWAGARGAQRRQLVLKEQMICQLQLPT
jgi:hypothetical protein